MLFALIRRQGFSFLCPVYRACGPNRKQYVLPDIGMRAAQGHSTCDDIGSGYRMAAQERLSMENEESLPIFVFTAQTQLLGKV